MKAFEVKTELLKHQRAAVEKLLPLRVGALFMEMGTGKSRTAIEFALHRRDKISKFVWFCPVSLKLTVWQEIRKHTDAEDVFMFDDKVNGRNIPAASWYIVGIESVSGSNRVAVAVEKLIDTRTMAVVDESSYIKGIDAKRTYRISKFCERAKYRMILTGTPMSQGVVDLYTQFRFLSPKILGYTSFYTFARNHLEYSDIYPGVIVRSHNIPVISAKIAPYTYQVEKASCMDLPEKLYDSHYVYMSGEQTKLYEETKEYFLEKIAERREGTAGMLIFSLFTALQEISCGFLRRWNRQRRDYDFFEVPHSRIDALDYLVRDQDSKTIIWAKYHYDITGIAKYLTGRFGADSVAMFHGKISAAKRAESVERFRADARFFLATPQCGGHGLTLNEAESVIFYNNGFKYAERLQAEDRSHRYGQAKTVTYTDIWVRCGIEERISDALASKGNAVEEFKREIDRIKDDPAAIRELVKKL